MFDISLMIFFVALTFSSILLLAKTPASTDRILVIKQLLRFAGICLVAYIVSNDISIELIKNYIG